VIPLRAVGTITRTGGTALYAQRGAAA